MTVSVETEVLGVEKLIRLNQAVINKSDSIGVTWLLIIVEAGIDLKNLAAAQVKAIKCIFALMKEDHIRVSFVFNGDGTAHPLPFKSLDSIQSIGSFDIIGTSGKIIFFNYDDWFGGRKVPIAEFHMQYVRPRNFPEKIGFSSLLFITDIPEDYTGVGAAMTSITVEQIFMQLTRKAPETETEVASCEHIQKIEADQPSHQLDCLVSQLLEVCSVVDILQRSRGNYENIDVCVNTSGLAGEKLTFVEAWQKVQPEFEKHRKYDIYDAPGDNQNYIAVDEPGFAGRFLVARRLRCRKANSLPFHCEWASCIEDVMSGLLNG